MSGWTVCTVRGVRSENYDRSEYNSTDPWDATADIVATMDRDGRVRSWETSSGHVYACLDCERYDFGFAEQLLNDYSDMVRDAVVLGANDTTDRGEARYYPDPQRTWADQYKETEGRHVGYRALAVMCARHGIRADDPFHDETGVLNDTYLKDGNVNNSVLGAGGET